MGIATGILPPKPESFDEFNERCKREQVNISECNSVLFIDKDNNPQVRWVPKAPKVLPL